VNLLNSLTWRSLKLNRKRTIVTVIGIILSTAMICATITIAASFQDLFIRQAKQTDGNFHATFNDVNPAQVKYITGNAYTETAMLSRNLGFARFDQSTKEYRPYFFIKEYDATALRHMPIKLTAGRYPEKTGEILLSEEAVESGGEAYQIGETIAFDLGERIDPEGQPLPDDSVVEEDEQFVTTATRAYTVTGLIAKPHFENFSSVPGFTAIAYLDPGRLGPGDKVNVSILGKNPRQIYDRVPEIAAAAGGLSYTYNNELLQYLGISKNYQAMAMLYSVAGIVILLIVVGSVTVIYNAFAISVSERKKQFGMLASTGATPGQIRNTVFFEGAILGLIGTPLGLLSGIGGIGVTLAVVNRLLLESIYNQDIALRLVVSPVTVWGTIAFVGLIILISTYLPAKRAAATSPIEAIRLSADIKIKGKDVKTSRLTRRLFGIEGELALKNLKRNRHRYRATVISLFISIVLFISFSSFINYGFKSADLYYGESFIPFDLAVTLYDGSPKDLESFSTQVAALDGVERCAVIREAVAESWLEGAQFGPYIQKNFIDQKLFPVNEAGRYQCTFRLVALGEDEFNAYAAANGLAAEAFKDTQNFRGILINKDILQERGTYAEYEPLHLKAGETLRLAAAEIPGDPEDPEITPPGFAMEIGAVTAAFPLGVFSAGLGAVNLIVSEELFNEICSLIQEKSEHQVEPGRDLMRTIYLCASDSAAVAEQIRAVHQDHFSHCSIFLHDVKAVEEEMNRTATVISIFFYGFITLITLIGATNIFNTISTNVALRRREFAMLKSVGLTPRGFNRMLNYESIFYGLKALLYGLPVGILISVWMYNAFGNMFEFAFALPGKEIFICVAGVFGIVFMTMMQAGARLKHDNIIDALKEENL
jgi:putative ABC transport system permease protein